MWPSLTGGSERRARPEGRGQEDRRFCASGSMYARLSLWREGTRGGGRSAWRGDVELAHAKCSTLRRPSERGLMQPGGRQKMQGHVLGRVALPRGV
jgi:hypothetical protein